MTYRQGHIDDLHKLKNLAVKSWEQFQSELTEDNWQKLKNSLTNDKTYTELLGKAYCLVCENDKAEIIGMSFLVPHGNPTEIYEDNWCYIRFVSVHPNFNGQGIGRRLTEKCIQYAKETKEQIIALHTSEIMIKARNIYESLGFKILREIEPRFGEKYWLYTLDIT